MYDPGIARIAGKHILDDLLSQVIKLAAQGNADVHKNGFCNDVPRDCLHPQHQSLDNSKMY